MDNEQSIYESWKIESYLIKAEVNPLSEQNTSNIRWRDKLFHRSSLILLYINNVKTYAEYSAE